MHDPTAPNRIAPNRIASPPTVGRRRAAARAAIFLGLTFLPWLCTQPTHAQVATLEQQLLAEPAADLAADARERGDADRGAFLFHSPGLGCAKCHATAQPVRSIGPDLADWSRAVDDLHLVESILQPSAKIEPSYQGRQVITFDGRSFTGMEVARSDEQITLRIGAGPEETVVIARDDLEAERPTDVSLMPGGQVNILRQRQEFLDLVAYLIAIRDGGREAAIRLQPSEESLRLVVPEYESDLDHRGLIAQWNQDSWKRGEAIYQRVCQNCHGTIEQAGSLPTSLRFAEGKFKFGNDPLSMYQTLTHGGGMMLPQTWMVPQQKYDVIHYIREHFLREHNPDQYFQITASYLGRLPQGTSRGPEPQVIEPWVTMDYGPMLITTIQFGEAPDNIAQKAIAIRVDDGPGGIARGKAWMAFEHDTLRMAAAWTDDFVDWNGIQFNGRHGVHLRAGGPIVAANPTGPGWAEPQTGSLVDDQRVVGRDGRRYGPLPNTWGKFRGLYRFENQVILDYTVGRTRVLENPRCLPLTTSPVFLRTMNLSDRSTPLEMVVLTIDPAATVEHRAMDEGDRFVVSGAGPSLSVWLSGFQDQAQLVQRDDRIVLRFRQGDQPLRGTVLITAAPWDPETTRTIDRELERVPTDLHKLTRGGPPQYPLELKVPSKRWFESEAWAVDELVRPEGNPWLARTRVTGLDFSADGRSLVVCTWDGDVWRVDGLESIGESNGPLNWRRIATGLFQPLGILWEADRMMVTCRDQLVALRDLNADGEIDHYECFNSDHQVTEHFHEFAMGLQRDPDGNYYYAKSARHALKAVVPHHGTLLRVSSGGERTEILATGFRAANGVCLNEDGSFIVTDQEGHWNPKNRINWVRPGGFYGNMYGYHDVTDASDQAMEPPLCWITNDFDRSPAELLWAQTDRWGPLNGQLLNLSYGYGRIYVVPHEFVPRSSTGLPSVSDGARPEEDPPGATQPQGGMCALPIPDLPTGMIRGRFSPRDGQLYLGGMFSWAGSRQDQEGGLFRVQYRGGPVNLPVGLHAVENGIEITFSDPLDAKSAESLERYQIKAWDLKRTKEYGSKHYNERQLPVTGAILQADQRTVRLVIPELAPTWGMEITCRLTDQQGREFRRVIHNTIHGLPTP